MYNLFIYVHVAVQYSISCVQVQTYKIFSFSFDLFKNFKCNCPVCEIFWKIYRLQPTAKLK